MRKKRKGFTLVELLVVIAIIALLMGILMPALARVRAIAFRVVCGTNLKGLGTAMLIYSNDHEDEFPQAGNGRAGWIISMPAWNAPLRVDAYGGIPGQVTVASSLYLLVRYSDVGVKQFLCKGTNTREFKPSEYPPPGLELMGVWDFGPKPIEHCSYSYHSAYATSGADYALNTGVSPPGVAVAADRNPWLDLDADEDYRDTFLLGWDGPAVQQKAGNAIAHGNDGQNVLFMDGHVTFEKRSFCGVMDDNIYTVCVNRDEPEQGLPPANGGARPTHREDSLLVNEGGAGGGPAPTTSTNGPPPP